MIINSNDKKNIFWNFLGLTINSFNSLFFLIIVNRINGQYDGGVFTFAYSLISLFFFIGIYFNRPYQISNDKFSYKELLVNRIISCLIMMLITFGYIYALHYDTYKATIIILICIFRMIEALSDIFYGIEQRGGELYKSGISIFLKGIFGLLIFFIIDLLTSNLIYATLSIGLINIVLFVIYDYPNCKASIVSNFKMINVIKIYKITFPIFLFSFLSMYLVNSSKYTLDFYETAEMQNIFGIILMPGTIISLCSQYILNPFLLYFKSDYDKGNFSDIFRKFSKIFIIIFVFGLLCEFIAFFIGIPILSFIYKIDLDNYKVHLLLILFGAVFSALIYIISSILTIMNKNNFQMINYIVFSVISIYLSIILIKNMGITGAVLNYLFIMVLQFISFYIYFKLFIINQKKRSDKND